MGKPTICYRVKTNRGRKFVYRIEEYYLGPLADQPPEVLAKLKKKVKR